MVKQKDSKRSLLVVQPESPKRDDVAMSELYIVLHIFSLIECNYLHICALMQCGQMCCCK